MGQHIQDKKTGQMRGQKPGPGTRAPSVSDLPAAPCATAPVPVDGSTDARTSAMHARFKEQIAVQEGRVTPPELTAGQIVRVKVWTKDNGWDNPREVWRVVQPQYSSGMGPSFTGEVLEGRHAGTVLAGQIRHIVGYETDRETG